ncbi:hypothetical protein [Streptomyces sp. NPDC048663]|uniref:hypothetical protein n=1 Tax=Streptomyces sp. NPDC048663 TaxID=3155638 RepID=UPI003421C5AF
MPTETPSPSLSPDAALPLLLLPDPDSLTEEQRSGTACVWTGAPLTTETAVDLSERRDGGGVLWFPRSNRRGVHDATMHTLHLHTQACEQCTDDYRACETGYALVRLERQYR